MKFNIVDHTGAQAEVDVNLQFTAEAKAAGAVHPLAHLDNKVLTNADQPTARQQVYAQMGLLRKGLKLQEAMDAVYAPANAGPAVDDSNLISGRLVTQSYLFDSIESKLRSSDYGLTEIFTRKAAAVDTINNTKFDRPILNFTRPEGARSRNIAQLSEPASMMLLTASDVSMRISSSSIGLEYSDEAAKQISIDIVTLSVTRQAETEALERIEGQLLTFLNGDADVGMSALSSVAGAVKNAKTDYDSTLTAGNLSQKAWVNWLFNGSRYRTINTVVTDLAGALAIENRANRPVVTGDNATSKRIDTSMSVLNPTWPDQVEVIISQDPNWPANTILGFDSRYGYHLVNSSSLAYSAVEQFAIRRSTKLRFDFGNLAYRLYDEAWSVLTLS